MRTRNSATDFAAYLIRSQRGGTLILLVDLCLLVAAVVAYADSAADAGTPSEALAITVGLAIFKLVWSGYKIRRTLRTYFHTSDSQLIRARFINQPFGPVTLDQILPSQEEEAAGFQACEADGERVFRSGKIDAFLWKRPRLEVAPNSSKPARVRRLIASNQNALLSLLARQFVQARGKQGFFNEEKLCLARGVDPTRTRVECFRGRYFDSVLTNEACTRALTDKEGDTLLADLTPMFPLEYNRQRHDVRLDTIAQSAMNDHIGVSTLGFTRDRYIVLWEQSSKALQSQGLLAPTGSGSCDWKDLDSSDFLGTLSRAMERELCEESGRNGLTIGSTVIGATRVLGFFRWVRRGGKPEFSGITRLELYRDQLEPNPAEIRRPSQKHQHAFFVGDIADLPATLQEIRGCGSLSVPLAMNLDCLERFHRDHKRDLAEFLFPPDAAVAGAHGDR